MSADLQPIERFEKRLRGVFQPDEGGDIVQWLQDNIKQIPFSPMPAGFNADETPWLKEPLRAIANDEFRLVQIIAPIQSGKSLMAELLSCYILTRVPAPTLYLHDTDDNANNWISTRLKVLWDNCPPVKEKIGEAIIKGKQNSFSTNGISFWCNGQFNLKNLQGKSIRWLVGDETWLWKKGHINEAMARVTSFGWLGKAVFMSQGSFVGDETHELWNTTTQNEWCFACPKCEHKQPWTWSQIRMPENAKDEDGEWDFNAVRTGITYECEGCKHRFKDSRESRSEMNKRGFYAAQNRNAVAENQGFRWNALCARSWGKIAEGRIRAEELKQSSGDTKPLEQWVQKQMGDFWTDAPDDYDISQVIGDYVFGDEWDNQMYIDTGTKRIHADKNHPSSIKARFMTVDVQRNGVYALARSWGQDAESRLFRWRFLDITQYGLPWDDLSSFAKACDVHPAMVFIDCGDQYDEVIKECGRRGWTALRGDARHEFIWRVRTPSGVKAIAKTYSAARLVNSGSGVVRVHNFSNLALKDQLTRLRRTKKHTIPNDINKEYLEQMESEVRVMNQAGKPEWKRIGKRDNHLWDCEVMQMVPAMAFGLLQVQAKPVDPNTQPEDVQEEGS
jgi:phage terminase large subunit GpA-like protein